MSQSHPRKLKDHEKSMASIGTSSYGSPTNKRTHFKSWKTVVGPGKRHNLSGIQAGILQSPLDSSLKHAHVPQLLKTAKYGHTYLDLWPLPYLVEIKDAE